jgi:hypothetical protein
MREITERAASATLRATCRGGSCCRAALITSTVISTSGRRDTNVASISASGIAPSPGTRRSSRMPGMCPFAVATSSDGSMVAIADAGTSSSASRSMPMRNSCQASKITPTLPRPMRWTRSSAASSVPIPPEFAMTSTPVDRSRWAARVAMAPMASAIRSAETTAPPGSARAIMGAPRASAAAKQSSSVAASNWRIRGEAVSADGEPGNGPMSGSMAATVRRWSSSERHRSASEWPALRAAR